MAGAFRLSLLLILLLTTACGTANDAEEAALEVANYVDAFRQGDAVLQAKLEKQVIARGHLAVPALVRLLGDASDQVQVLAMDTLARIGEPAVPALLDALESSSVERQKNALLVLDRLGRPETFDQIARVLERGTPDLSLLAARLLARHGDRRGLEFFMKMLRSPDKKTRLRAVHELGDAKVVEALLPLTQLLRDKDGAIRLAAAQALGQLGDDRVSNYLRRASMEDRSVQVRRAAATALARVTGREQSYLDEHRRWRSVGPDDL